jgi:hypothetical protein
VVTPATEPNDFSKTPTDPTSKLSSAATPTGSGTTPVTSETEAATPSTRGNRRTFSSNRVGNAAVGLHDGAAAAAAQRRSRVTEPLARTAEGGEGDAPAADAERPLIQGAGSTYGIDMCEFSFIVDPDTFDPDPGHWDEFSAARWGDREGGKYVINGNKRGPVPHRITVYSEPRWEAFVTYYNPSNLAGPGVTALWDPRFLTLACAALVDEHRDLLTPRTFGVKDPMEVVGAFKVNRLDIARDLVTEGTERWAKIIGAKSIPHWSTKLMGVKNGVPGTVYIGKKNGECLRIYDKHVQSGGVSPVGMLRVEYQLRRPDLTAAGIGNLSSATPEKIQAAFLRRWFQAHMDDPVTDGSTYEALDKLGVSAVRQYALAGYMSAMADGQPAKGSPKTIRGYRADLRRAGLHPGDPVKATAGSTRYLDVYVGREIVIGNAQPPV